MDALQREIGEAENAQLKVAEDEARRQQLDRDKTALRNRLNALLTAINKKHKSLQKAVWLTTGGCREYFTDESENHIGEGKDGDAKKLPCCKELSRGDFDDAWTKYTDEVRNWRDRGIEAINVDLSMQNKNGRLAKST